jgi:hypothetical protein
MTFSNIYTDLYDNKLELTQNELNYFYNTVNHIKEKLNIDIEIVNRNHETLKGKEKEAYGICYKSLHDNNDLFITIDNFFIHECYEEKFNNKYNLSFESLEHCICHEIAHIQEWRHGKKHTELTEILYNKVI